MKAKQDKQKANKVPKTPIAFYIKLYCKQKSSSKTKYQSNLIEATKSWLSLSDSEKQQVSAKHKELENKLKLKCFDELKDAEPFMKVKDPGLPNVSLNTINLEIPESEAYTKENEFQPDTDQANQIENEDVTLGIEQIIANLEPQQDQEEHNEALVEPAAVSVASSRPFLEEPLPPTLKTGKDLHTILHSATELDVPWASLPQLERNQYNRAVSLLKRDYIIKFKEYLESLTQKELFDYYNKTVF